MKAIVQDRYGSADVLKLRDVPRPAIGEDGVLLRVHAAGLDPGVWHVMAGLPYLVRVMGYGLRRPRDGIRGTDVAGRVAAVGPNVTAFRPGDEVFGTCTGSFAEYASAHHENLAPRPENLSLEQAAAVPVSARTALHALRDKAHVQPKQKVLITGAGGGVGTFAVQLARSFHAEVTAVCSAGKADHVGTAGAHHVIDYTQEDFTDGRRRYDVILDCAGRTPLSRLRRALTPRGTLVIVGGEGGGRWLGGFDRSILRAPLLSLFVGQRLLSVVPKQRRQDLLDLKDLSEGGAFTPVIDRTYPLSEVAEAVRYLRAGHVRGKVVITP
jgi:NADPH:quinone reductase-like Zn-dependent oxidoreductase